MFCHITQTWRATPLVSRVAIVELIGNTTTKTGLTVRCELDVAVAGCVGNSRGCLRRDDGIASGGEVNHALGGRLTKALPAINLAHADLT
jgi:DDE family transposase